jgi:16S rRNA (guanine527-N7)-methyltransferase
MDTWKKTLRDIVTTTPSLTASPLFLEKLFIFGSSLLKWNKAANLISRKNPETILVKLIVDSLFLLNIIKGDEAFLDIGTGAGFPAIPVLLGSHTRGILAEARKKRAVFLNHAIHTLKIETAAVLEQTLTQNTPLETNGFDCLWSKAGIPREQLFAIGEKYLRPGGLLVLLHSMNTIPEDKRMRLLAENHGFKNIRRTEFQCPKLSLTRTFITCEK